MLLRLTKGTVLLRGFFKMEFTGSVGQGGGAIAFIDGKVVRCLFQAH